MKFEIRDNHCFVPILRFGWLNLAVLPVGRSFVAGNYELLARLNADAEALAEAAEIEGDPTRIWSDIWAFEDERNEATPRLRELARSLTTRLRAYGVEK